MNDWKKPKDAKGWESKVDYELWKRLDPQRAGLDDVQFVHREVEDEIRTEVDREASVLKSRSKLAGQKGSADNLKTF